MMERLQKYLANCGVASRRKCEELILAGSVKVNGEIIKELGTKIDIEKDIVEYNGKLVKAEETKRYIMLNKPVGIISSVSDEKGRKTIIDIINAKERIYPIGRLDYDSSGLLLLTNDGEIYNKIIHPRREIHKTYIVKVKGVFTDKEMETFQNGVDIGGYITAKSSIKILWKDQNNCKVEIKIHEGKNRQIRKMCAALNHDVISLKRVAIGEINIGDLELGSFRELTDSELNYIKSL
ncbi:pseudouridine synthase [Clostridium sp. YIM B02551]|uniref:pseudouridine synthase n=1 Tax=Clostridium sp. YIM B02551 TaxID=2910679 RepID=UPI001EEA7810